jgi:hypothetical protein
MSASLSVILCQLLHCQQQTDLIPEWCSVPTSSSTQTQAAPSVSQGNTAYMHLKTSGSFSERRKLALSTIQGEYWRAFAKCMVGLRLMAATMKRKPLLPHPATTIPYYLLTTSLSNSVNASDSDTAHIEWLCERDSKVQEVFSRGDEDEIARVASLVS